MNFPALGSCVVSVKSMKASWSQGYCKHTQNWMEERKQKTVKWPVLAHDGERGGKNYTTIVFTLEKNRWNSIHTLCLTSACCFLLSNEEESFWEAENYFYLRRTIFQKLPVWGIPIPPYEVWAYLLKGIIVLLTSLFPAVFLQPFQKKT